MVVKTSNPKFVADLSRDRGQGRICSRFGQLRRNIFYSSKVGPAQPSLFEPDPQENFWSQGIGVNGLSLICAKFWSQRIHCLSLICRKWVAGNLFPLPVPDLQEIFGRREFVSCPWSAGNFVHREFVSTACHCSAGKGGRELFSTACHCSAGNGLQGICFHCLCLVSRNFCSQVICFHCLSLFCRKWVAGNLFPLLVTVLQEMGCRQFPSTACAWSAGNLFTGNLFPLLVTVLQEMGCREFVSTACA